MSDASLPTQSKYWVYTLNNPTTPTDWNGKVKYAVYQNEIGESGTPHEQGYLEFAENKRLAALKKILPTAHFEVRRGTAQQARDYAMKDDTRAPGVNQGPFHFGVFTNSFKGKRNDLLAVKADIDEGTMTYAQLVDKHWNHYVRHDKFFVKYQAIKENEKKKDWKTYTIVLIGPTDIGKSRYCKINYPDAYWKEDSQWWDGYDHHEAVVLDDFYGWLKYHTLLRLADEYPYTVQPKGTTVNWLAKTLLITSNEDPRLWYKKKKSIRPLLRRIDKWIWARGKNDFVEYDNYTDFYDNYVAADPEPEDLPLPNTPQYLPPPDSPDPYSGNKLPMLK